MDSYILDNYPLLDLITFDESNKNLIDNFLNKIEYSSEFKEFGIQHIVDFNKYKFITSFISGKIKDNILYIKYIDVRLNYQNNGYGTFLIKELTKYCYEKYGILYIEADDTTERDPPNNIFYKLGFYVNDYKFNEKGKYIKHLVKWKDNIGADVDEYRVIKTEELL